MGDVQMMKKTHDEVVKIWLTQLFDRHLPLYLLWSEVRFELQH